MNPHDEKDRRELISEVEFSRWKMEDVRNARKALVKRSAGSEWYPDGSDDDVPYNQMNQTENIIVQYLIGGEPQANVVAMDSQYEYQAYEQTLALNKQAQLVSLRKKLRRLVRDALYGIGILKIGMIKDRSLALEEIAPNLDEEGEVGVGRLSLQVISFDNFVFDTQADTMAEADFLGHSYWVKQKDIKKYLPGYDLDDLFDSEKNWIDEHGNEMVGAISRGTEGGDRQVGPGKRFWLWDLWLPKERALVRTLVNGTGEIAHVIPWKSRPGGPYLYLSYSEICDQAIPKAIMSDLAIIHDSINSTFNKLIDQTADAKTVLGYRPGHEDDAQRIAEAGNLAAIQMRDPDQVKEFNFNGPDQALLGMLLQERELASLVMRNTDTLGGLGFEAPTATQEQMVDARANVGIEYLEYETLNFVVEVFEAMRWFMYNEQTAPIPITKSIDGFDFKVKSEYNAFRAAETPDEFDVYEMQIVPDTLRYRSTEDRLQRILTLWERVFLPAFQLGLTTEVPDMDALFELCSRYENLPELKRILRFATMKEMESRGGGGGEAKQSPVTTRNYVRHGAPGPSQHGKAMNAMQLMGSGAEGA